MGEEEDGDDDDLRKPKSDSTTPTMAEFDGPHRHHLLQLLHQISNGSYAPAPLLRGPMYSTYAELRAQRLRRRRAPPSTGPADPVFATPKRSTPASSLRRSMPVFCARGSKENRKPPWGSSMTPPPPSPAAARAAANRLGSVSACKAQDKKRFGAAAVVPASAGRDGRAIAARKSYACLQEIRGFAAVASETANRRTKNIW